MFLAPLGNFLANPLIERTSVNHSVLEFSAGRIRGFYQYKNTLIFFFTYINKWLHTIRTQIWIYCSKIFVKSCIFLTSYLHLSQMSYCISCRSRTDISTFDITDHYQTFLLTVIYCIFVCHHSGNSKLLVHGNLWFHCRYQITDCIYNSLIILPDCFSCTFQSFSQLPESFILDMLWDIIKHRIQSHYDRCVCFLNFFNKFVNHGFSS